MFSRALSSACPVAWYLAWTGFALLPIPALSAMEGTEAWIRFEGFMQHDGYDQGMLPALSGDAASVAWLHRPDSGAGPLVIDIHSVADASLVRRFVLLAAGESTRDLSEEATEKVRARLEEANAYLEERGFLTMQVLFYLRENSVPSRPVEEILNWKRRITWEAETRTLTVGQVWAESMFGDHVEDDHPFVPRSYRTDPVEFSRSWPLRERRASTVGAPAECEVRPMPQQGWVNLDWPPERPPVMVLQVGFVPLDEDCAVPDEWLVIPLR